MRIIILLLVFLPLICCAQVSGIPEVLKRDLPPKTIAIILDQPSEHFDRIIAGFTDALKPLARDQYKLEYLSLQPASNSLADVNKTLNDALDNPLVEVIFTAGMASSHAALRLPAEQRSKPVIAGAIEFSDLDNALVTDEDTSKIQNYSFVLMRSRLLADLTALSSLAKTKKIDVLIEEQIINTLGADLTKNVAAFEEKNDLDLQIIPISPGDISLSNLSSNTRAVYVPLLPSMTVEQRKAIFVTLAKKKKINLSMLGPNDVDVGDDDDIGAFACLAPQISETLHRRLALNLHQALLGINTNHLPVLLKLADQLKINLVTARQIGWSPDYDTALSATFFKQDEVIQYSGNLSLEVAMATAARRNPNIKAAKAAWQSTLADVLATNARYSTTANLVGQAGGQSNRDRINPLTTPKYAGSASLGVEVNRLLYSDELYQQIESLSQRSEAAKLDSQSIVLDTVESTAHAYLDSLLAEAIYRIQRANVLLVQENLGLAEIRRGIGAEDNTDSFRWQASLASARSQLISADSSRRSARSELNVQLAADAQKHWDLQDITLEDKQTYFLDGSLGELIANKKQFEGFIRFTRALASANAPEIKSFDYNLRAEGIRMEERKQRHKRPQVSLNAAVRRVFEDSSISTGGTQNEWTVGLGFTLPFLEGDLRDADVSKIQAGIAQLQAQRERAVYLVEQRALVACYNMAASHPAVRLSRMARIASGKNYKNIKEKYYQGQVNIVTLIDAQSNLLSQQQAEANSVYTYLKDTLSLQRAIAWFEYSKSKPQISDFIQHYRDFQKTGSVHVRVLKK